MCGVDTPTFHRDRPGMSAFVMEDGAIYHTYSTFSRGLDGLWGAYQWIDRAPLGRNEAGAGPWWKRLGWFFGLWAAGVLVVGSVAYFIRWWLV